MPRHSLQMGSAAQKSWRKLDKGVKEQFIKVLDRRLDEPRILSAALSGELEGFYKIKIAKSGHRLVYWVNEEEIVLLVVAVGKREDGKVYRQAAKFFQEFMNSKPD